MFQYLKEFKLAIPFYETVLKANPNNETAVAKTNRCYYHLEEYDLALKYSLQLYKIDPDNSEYISALALDYAESGNIEQAIELSEKAFIMDSNSPNMIFSYGRILFMAKDFSKAKIIFNKCIKLKKDKSFHGISYGNLGHIYLFEKNIEKSNEFYKKCVLTFDDIKDFEEKFESDLCYAESNNISAQEYRKIKQELISYWQEKK